MKKFCCVILNIRRGTLARAFVTMLGRSPLLKLKPSTRHLAGNNFDHSSYCPDLAPSDFLLFFCLKKFLAGQRFVNNDDVKVAVKK
jgi:hypothetical protein